MLISQMEKRRLVQEVPAPATQPVSRGAGRAGQFFDSRSCAVFSLPSTHSCSLHLITDTRRQHAEGLPFALTRPLEVKEDVGLEGSERAVSKSSASRLGTTAASSSGSEREKPVLGGRPGLVKATFLRL